MTWRIGQHYGIHVYDGDRPVATFHSAEDAAQAVAAVNARSDQQYALRHFMTNTSVAVDLYTLRCSCGWEVREPKHYPQAHRLARAHLEPTDD